MHKLFKSFGIRSLHSTSWSIKPIPNKFLNDYTAFSDGGGHVWLSDYEFGNNHEIRILDKYYPNSRFILITRDLESWVISKMLHAGWHEGAVLQEPKEVTQKEWTFKSLDVIRKWIINRSKYHKKVKEYFKNRPNDLLIINLIEDREAVNNIVKFLGIENSICIVESMGILKRVANFLKLRNYVKAEPPHENTNLALERQKKYCYEMYKTALSGLNKKWLEE